MRHLALALLPALALAAACGSDEPIDASTLDLDGDGVPGAADCNDADARIYPSAEELCDGLDNDCNGTVDDGEGVLVTFFADADTDGFGDAAATLEACTAPDGYVRDATDCDDADARFYPGAPEIDCTDPSDYNCDGSVGYADADADGFAACEECADDDAARNPEADELCNALDDDCNGVVDDDAVDRATFHLDRDGDGYGDPEVSELACEARAGFVTDATDCNDGDRLSFPGAEEQCDGADNDCDGSAAGEGDDDLDGFLACDDCDDTTATVFPGADEYCNEVDDDCDGTTDEAAAVDARLWYPDDDRDGWGDLAATPTPACSQPSGSVLKVGDCDDDEAGANPSAPERCSTAFDDNCDGQINEATATDATPWFEDGDGDGFGDRLSTERACTQPSGYVRDDTDCNDSNDTIYPGADEVCSTTVDDDCDGVANESDAVDADPWFLDADSDGFGNASRTTPACTRPSGYVDDDDDCDDTDDDVYPGADELCNGDDDDCDGDTDEDDAIDVATWYEDADGDGYGNPESTDEACDAPEGFLADDRDCDDEDEDVNPDADDVCDEVDNDCSGTADDDDAYLGSSKVCPADTCNDVLDARPGASDGTYWIDPAGGSELQTYCDMTTDGGGWTLASYAYSGSTSTSSSNYNHWSLKCGGGTFAPTSRGRSSAAIASVELAQASTEMAIALSLSGGVVTSGNMSAYDRAYKFSIPDPSAVTFVNHAYNGGAWGSGASQAGACTSVTVTGLVGQSGTWTRYLVEHSLGSSWTDSYPTGYGPQTASNCVLGNGGPFVTSFHSGDGWGGSHGATSTACDIRTAGRTQYVYRGGGWTPTSTGHTGSSAIWFR